MAPVVRSRLMVYRRDVRHKPSGKEPRVAEFVISAWDAMVCGGSRGRAADSQRNGLGQVCRGRGLQGGPGLREGALCRPSPGRFTAWGTERPCHQPLATATGARAAATAELCSPAATRSAPAGEPVDLAGRPTASPAARGAHSAKPLGPANGHATTAAELRSVPVGRAGSAAGLRSFANGRGPFAGCPSVAPASAGARAGPACQAALRGQPLCRRRRGIRSGLSSKPGPGVPLQPGDLLPATSRPGALARGLSGVSA